MSRKHLLAILFVCTAFAVAAADSSSVAGRGPSSSQFEQTPQVRSLSSLSQVVNQLESCVSKKDLSSIHNEDTILGVALNSMFQRLDIVAAAERGKFTNDLAQFAQSVSALHLAGDLGRQENAERELKNVQRSFDQVKSHFPEWTRAAADKSTNTFTCPMHSDVIGGRTNFCAKCGMELDRLVRILPPDSDPRSLQLAVKASIRTSEPLAVGHPCSAVLKLERPDGSPVYLSELIESHTKRIHLLIVDRSLIDYHHEHPVPTKTPGEYSFSFTPKRPGSYRAWADLRVQPLGIQEYAMTDISASTTPEQLSDRGPALRRA